MLMKSKATNALLSNYTQVLEIKAPNVRGFYLCNKRTLLSIEKAFY